MKAAKAEIAKLEVELAKREKANTELEYEINNKQATIDTNMDTIAKLEGELDNIHNDFTKLS